MRAWPDTAAAYGTDDLSEIMERTRASLLGCPYPLAPEQKDLWWTPASIVRNLIHDLAINLQQLPTFSSGNTKAIQKYGIWGRYDKPVYIYDLRSAYLSAIHKIPGMEQFTEILWQARCYLKARQDPTAGVIKVLNTIIWGLFQSTVVAPQYRRPDLASFTVGYVRRLILEAEQEIRKRHGIVIRTHTDGIIATVDITDWLEQRSPGVGDRLGQWKPVEQYPGITIGGTSLWWRQDDHKTNGLVSAATGELVAECEFLRQPEGLLVTQEYVDWNTSLRVKLKDPWSLRHRHDHSLCIPGADWHFTTQEGNAQCS
jgi:hypothetical protein